MSDVTRLRVQAGTPIPTIITLALNRRIPVEVVEVEDPTKAIVDWSSHDGIVEEVIVTAFTQENGKAALEEVLSSIDQDREPEWGELEIRFEDGKVFGFPDFQAGVGRHSTVAGPAAATGRDVMIAIEDALAYARESDILIVDFTVHGDLAHKWGAAIDVMGLGVRDNWKML